MEYIQDKLPKRVIKAIKKGYVNKEFTGSVRNLRCVKGLLDTVAIPSVRS